MKANTREMEIRVVFKAILIICFFLRANKYITNIIREKKTLVNEEWAVFYRRYL